ncbi:hypothetical protein ACN28I_21930 [Archangium gephyra]
MPATDKERTTFCTACFSGKSLTGNLNPGVPGRRPDERTPSQTVGTEGDA